MKQGTAHNTRAGGSVEAPKTRAVNPGGVDQLGQVLAHKGTPLFAGRGYEAPTHKDEVHHCGSQGKHK